MVTKIRPLLYQGLKWLVGNGNNIEAWHNNWTPSPAEKIFPSKPPDCEDIKVRDYLTIDGSWDLQKLEKGWPQRLGNNISSIRLSEFQKEDSIYWSFDRFGRYTVWWAYKFMDRWINDSATLVNKIFRKTWRSNILQKIRLLLWQGRIQVIPTVEVLKEHNCQVDLVSVCVFNVRRAQTISFLNLLLLEQYGFTSAFMK